MITHIDDLPVPLGLTFQVDYNTQSTPDSGRDLSGTMHNTFLPFKYKLYETWASQSLADRAALMTLIYTRPNLSNLKITFLDPQTGASRNIYCMIGTPATQTLLNTGSASPEYWHTLAINFIEV